MVDKNKIQTIASSIHYSWDINRIHISESKGGFSCEFGFNFNQFIPAVLSFMLTDQYKKQNQETMRFFYDSFGEWRVKRISERWGLDLPLKYRHGQALSAYDVKALFVGMGDVRLEDIERIYWDIRETRAEYLDLSPERRSELQKQFTSRRFSQLRKKDFDTLYSLAVPFDDIHTLFCYQIPSFQKDENPDFLVNTSSDLAELKNRVFLMEEMRRSTSHSEIAETIRKVKKIYAYALPEGLVMPQSEGYTYVFRMVNEFGSYKFFHKSLTKDECPNLVSILGTQVQNRSVPRGWETLYLDLHPNLGAHGAISTYEDTKALLERPELGFVDAPGERVDFIGMSLGGALAAFDSCLFLDRVRRVTLVGNPGIDHFTIQRLAEKVRTLQHKIYVTMIWDTDDVVRLLGDGHFGLFCDPNKMQIDAHFITPVKPGESFPKRVAEGPVRPASPIEAVQRMLYSLFGPHLRETTNIEFRDSVPLERQYSVLHLSNRDAKQRAELERLLDNRTKGWDKLRRTLFSWLGDPDAFYRFWLSVS